MGALRHAADQRSGAAPARRLLAHAAGESPAAPVCHLATSSPAFMLNCDKLFLMKGLRLLSFSQEGILSRDDASILWSGMN